jgi:membrane-bound lytic murein transglycosylase D
MLRVLLLVTLFTFTTASASTKHFPVKAEMKKRVAFWEKVYTQITTREAFIHDSDNVSIIYKKVKLKKTRKAQARAAKKEKKRIAAIIRSIAKKKYKNLTKTEKHYAKIIGKRSSKVLNRMARRIRYQYGLKDRYYKGLIRSYAYMDYIDRQMKKLNLPNELKYLPHVESSFNYRASSKVGAAGIWQFMRSTAKQYKLKVGYVVDERRDPLKATRAAARLLKDNYRMLKSWPLALTAYNQGVGNIRKAVRKVGTKNINTIVEKYNGRNFGFASKNFYATFMATVYISKNPSKYFPKFKKPRKFRYSEIKLKRPYTVPEISKALNISTKVIKNYNPSIRRSAYRSQLYIPRGFILHIPSVSKKLLTKYRTKLITMKGTYASAKFDKLHIVSKNENLSDIARAYRIKLNQLIQYNNIANPSLIYAGMKLRIPQKNKPASSQIKLKKRNKGPAINPVAQKLDAKDIAPKISLESYNLNTLRLSKNFYSIRIEVQETLGHIAEWANTTTSRIKKDNKMRSPYIKLNQRVILELSPKELVEFKKKRNEFHLSIQEDFYAAYKIVGDRKYRVKRGDTLGGILKKNSLPLWLVRMYQNVKGGRLTIMSGQNLKLPRVKPRSV